VGRVQSEVDMRLGTDIKPKGKTTHARGFSPVTFVKEYFNL